jgi:hypothetical protein
MAGVVKLKKATAPWGPEGHRHGVMARLAALIIVLQFFAPFTVTCLVDITSPRLTMAARPGYAGM